MLPPTPTLPTTVQSDRRRRPPTCGIASDGVCNQIWECAFGRFVRKDVEQQQTAEGSWLSTARTCSAPLEAYIARLRCPRLKNRR